MYIYSDKQDGDILGHAPQYYCQITVYLRKHTDYLTTESCLSLSDFVLSGLNPNKVRAFLKMVVGPRSEVATVCFYDWEDDWEEE